MRKSKWWRSLANRKGRATTPRRVPWLEVLEGRCQPATFRPIDEVGNNVGNPNLGIAGTDLLRQSPAAYKPVANGGDGLNIPSMTYGAPTFVAGPRLVSNVVSNQAEVIFGPTDINTVNQNGLSDFGYTWGQFLDHDMDLSPTLSGRITATSWTGGVATITVADGLFRANDSITVRNMVPAGYNGTFTVLTASVNADHSTTLTYALPTDPGPATTFGTVADTTTKDGSNGFPIPKDPTHPTDPIGQDPNSANTTLAFTRSIFDPTTGVTAPREQINAVTSYLDLSQVYGSTVSLADALRTHMGGLLKSSPGPNGIFGDGDDLLPYNNQTYFPGIHKNNDPNNPAAFDIANDAHLVPDDQLFMAGDVRVNETTELTSLHTLFLRNHNRLATQLAGMNPADFGLTSWTDENLYQEARKLNIAMEQAITYNGYLPALLGPTAIAAYTDYNPNGTPGGPGDPSISTEFSTIAFRFGHSLLNNTVPRDANDGSSIGEIPLAVSFFNPGLLNPNGTPDPFGNTPSDIGAILKGNADNNAQANDVLAVSAIRNLLFGQGGQGEDLIARDLWRADDHGIGTYNQVRAAFGLPLITDTGGGTFADYVEGQPFHGFEQISGDPAVVTKLVTAFTGPSRDTVPGFLSTGHFAGDINPFIAGLAEDHVPGSDLGPLFHAILVDQFSRLRNGDRFFYLNDVFSAAEQSILNAGNTLGKVITANTNITNLQADVFRFLAQQDGKTKGYYSNTNGRAEVTGSSTGTTLTDALFNGLVGALANPDQPGFLVLKDANGNYLSASFLQSYSNFKSFLMTNSSNMANKLSIQLLTTEVNIVLGKVDPTKSIYVPAVTIPGTGQTLSPTLQSSLQANGVSNPSGIAKIQDILNAAIAQLRSSSPDSVFEEALKACLEGINNNQQIFIL